MGSQEDLNGFHLLGYKNRTPLALCLDQMIHNEDLGIQNLAVKAFDVTRKDYHHEAQHLAMNQSY